MYARRLRSRSQHVGFLLGQCTCSIKSIGSEFSLARANQSDLYRNQILKDGFVRKFSSTSSTISRSNYIKLLRTYNSSFLSSSCRYYCSKGDGSSASGGKHASVTDANFDKVATPKEEVVAQSKHNHEHAWFGEQDQQEWLDLEKLSIECKRKESPFLTKRQRFKNEFLRRVVSWEKIKVSWDNFPYNISEHTKNLLVDCAAAHLKHKNVASSYGARLHSSSRRILLQGIPGTELYRERVVRALARDLRVPLLVLDSNVLAPYDFGQECTSEDETDDEHTESVEESTSESDSEDESNASNEGWASNNETKSGGSGEDDDVQTSAEALKKLLPCSLEEFAKRVSGEFNSASTSAESDATASTEQPKKPLRKGVRVKYVGPPVNFEVDNRSLSTGQRGEVYEINGDQVAVILDNPENKSDDGKNCETQQDPDAKPSIYWIDIQDIVCDLDTQIEDWLMSMESLCEILPSLQPVIVYFPDCSRWLSRAVSRSNRKAFVLKVEGMFDQLPGPIVLICGENILETGSKEKDKITMVLPGLGRVSQLPLPLKRITEGLLPSKSSKGKDVFKLFNNGIYIHPPEEEEKRRIFIKQIEEDRRIIISRSNLVELHKVLQENDLCCLNLLHVKTDGVILTKREAEKVVGWARNHHLSSVITPSVKGDRLIIPSESLETAITRLKEEDMIFRRPSQSIKPVIAKDEFEKAFVHALVPPEEVGVKFEDIGALEDVKTTLNELVSLPMRRPELFSRGNLLRPCKGILLFGPPGTGKTLLAKALATEAGANFLNVTSSSLTSKWFGDAEKLTRALFSFASRLTPVIIFIDEVDSLLGARGGAFEHEATRRIRNEFMAAWDGLKSKDSQRILILGATNRPFDLDDAVIRRLPRRIYVDLPDAGNRAKILRVLLSQENIEPGFRFDELANATEGYSGSDLKNLCIAAAYMPVQELLEEEKKGDKSGMTPALRLLKLDDFIKAKAKVSASVAYDATSMNALREWNEKYGEGGSRRQSPFGFGN